jgi:hypothetical protein
MLALIRSSSSSLKRLGQECAAQMPEKLCRRAAATD